MTNMELLVLAILLRSSLAQTTVTDYVNPQTTSTYDEAATHTVSVGYGGFTFIPSVIQANVGDTVEFDFYPLNHSVVRAEYKIPCVPYELTGPKIGFFSGFQPVDAILSNPPKWTVLINDTNPVFYYCSAPGSCIDHQMVGVINPNATTSIAVQRDYARNSTFMLQPGDSWPAEASSSLIPTSTAVSSSTEASSPTSAPAQTTSAAPSSSHSSGLPAGAIAGIAIGGAAVLLAAGFLIWWCGRNSRQAQKQPEAPPTYAPTQFASYPPMSPSMKHFSGVAGSPTYPSYPYAEHPTMGPFGAVPASPPSQHHQQVYAPQPSPGHDQTSPLMGPLNRPGVAEVDSMRGRSPSPRPGGNAGGIAAFLERNAQSSPNMEHSESGHGNSVNGQHPNTGPYEMSAGNNMGRS